MAGMFDQGAGGQPTYTAGAGQAGSTGAPAMPQRTQMAGTGGTQFTPPNLLEFLRARQVPQTGGASASGNLNYAQNGYNTLLNQRNQQGGYGQATYPTAPTGQPSYGAPPTSGLGLGYNQMQGMLNYPQQQQANTATANRPLGGTVSGGMGMNEAGTNQAGGYGQAATMAPPLVFANGIQGVPSAQQNLGAFLNAAGQRAAAATGAPPVGQQGMTGQAVSPMTPTGQAQYPVAPPSSPVGRILSNNASYPTEKGGAGQGQNMPAVSPQWLQGSANGTITPFPMNPGDPNYAAWKAAGGPLIGTPAYAKWAQSIAPAPTPGLTFTQQSASPQPNNNASDLPGTSNPNINEGASPNAALPSGGPPPPRGGVQPTLYHDMGDPVVPGRPPAGDTPPFATATLDAQRPGGGMGMMRPGQVPVNFAQGEVDQGIPRQQTGGAIPPPPQVPQFAPNQIVNTSPAYGAMTMSQAQAMQQTPQYQGIRAQVDQIGNQMRAGQITPQQAQGMALPLQQQLNDLALAQNGYQVGNLFGTVDQAATANAQTAQAQAAAGTAGSTPFWQLSPEQQQALLGSNYQPAMQSPVGFGPTYTAGG